MLQLLETIKTEKQTIRFYEVEDKTQLLTLNTYAQYKEGEDERIYHQTITDSAFKLNPNAKEVLILGGGDGLVARNVRLINPSIHITLVDYDKQLVSLFLTREYLVKLNHGSLLFCNLFFEDASSWVKKHKKKFDLIILDLPDPTSKELERLYQKTFYKDCCNLLNLKGVIIIQSRLDLRFKIARYIQKILKNYKIVEYEMPWMGLGAFILGKNANI